jgi:hypothetical protein
MVVIVLPIFVLPSVAGLENILSAPLAPFVLGNPSLVAIVVAGAIVLGVVLWLLGASVLGGWLELEFVDEAARDPELELGPWPGSAPGGLDRFAAGQVLAARLVFHALTLVAVAYATVRIVAATYGELTVPGAPATPFMTRLVERVPDALILVFLAWAVAEALGGLAARWIAAGAGFSRAVGRALRGVTRPSALATLVVTDVGVAVLLLPFWLAGALAWGRLRLALGAGAPDVVVGAALVLLLLGWGVGLVVFGAGLAWRNAAWTAEVFGQPNA